MCLHALTMIGFTKLITVLIDIGDIAVWTCFKTPWRILFMFQWVFAAFNASAKTCSQHEDKQPDVHS